jgi:hypothetical protein
MPQDNQLSNITLQIERPKGLTTFALVTGLVCMILSFRLILASSSGSQDAAFAVLFAIVFLIGALSSLGLLFRKNWARIILLTFSDVLVISAAISVLGPMLMVLLRNGLGEAFLFVGKFFFEEMPWYFTVGILVSIFGGTYSLEYLSKHEVRLYFHYLQAVNLESLLDDTNPSRPCKIRRLALFGLFNIEHDKALDTLLSALKDEDAFIRSDAAQFLGTKTSPSVAPALVVALGDKNADVRKQAVSSLGKIKSIEALESLTKLSNEDAASAVRLAAKNAIDKIKAAK